MLQMIELVGTAAEGFSAAVRAALDEAARRGFKAHFFQVVEQRGSVRDGEIREFQVVVKIAVES